MRAALFAAAYTLADWTAWVVEPFGLGALFGEVSG